MTNLFGLTDGAAQVAVLNALRAEGFDARPVERKLGPAVGVAGKLDDAARERAWRITKQADPGAREWPPIVFVR